jgi:hypothetical protein
VFLDSSSRLTNIARALCANGCFIVLVWQTFERNHWVRDFT